jgi:SEC-C motif
MSRRKTKIGRNESCPCGSGLKYKRCCGDSSARQRSSPTVRHTEIPPEVQQAFIEQQLREAERIRKYGHVRPTLSLDFQGHKFVAVGNALHYDKSWKTFTDFLWTHLPGVVGKEWGDAEIKKPLEERHPIVQWYHRLCEFQSMHAAEASGEIYSAIATGPVMAYTALAYDLYTVAHHALLQDKLIKRLKVKQQFQGARYETYVCATFIRAGFDVVLEDEGNSATTHCEFTATHKETGLKYSVEAKSRHRPGILGTPGMPKPLSEIEADVFKLLQEALLKQACHDRIIFIDTNVPPDGIISLETQLLNKVVEQVIRLEERQLPDKPWPPAFIVFTNHPYHYVGNDQLVPSTAAIFSSINMPESKVPYPAFSRKYPAIAQLCYSVIHHTAIPQGFPNINTMGQ